MRESISDVLSLPALGSYGLPRKLAQWRRAIMKGPWSRWTCDLCPEQFGKVTGDCKRKERDNRSSGSTRECGRRICRGRRKRRTKSKYTHIHWKRTVVLGQEAGQGFPEHSPQLWTWDRRQDSEGARRRTRVEGPAKDLWEARMLATELETRMRPKKENRE